MVLAVSEMKDDPRFHSPAHVIPWFWWSLQREDFFLRWCGDSSLDWRRKKQALRSQAGARWHLLVQRDGAQCANCGWGFELETDHIHPIFKGGDSSMSNLHILCHDCHRVKSMFESVRIPP